MWPLRFAPFQSYPTRFRPRNFGSHGSLGWANGGRYPLAA